MIKKLITGTAFIVAGTALAGAAETITASTTASYISQGRYNGVVFTLDADTYTNEAGYTLDSYSVILGSGFSTDTAATTDIATGDYSLVVYSVASDGTLAYVASGEITYDSSGKMYGETTSTFWTRGSIGTTFTDAVIYAGTSYLVAAVATEDLASAEDLTVFDSGILITVRYTTASGTFYSEFDTTNTYFVDSSGAATSSGYAPVITVVLTEVEATIPEPSAFGILAGFGALALAASRRRRSRKVA